MTSTEKVFCEDPDNELTGPRIDRWKYDMVSAAILDALPARGGGLSFSQLEDELRMQLRSDKAEKLGSLSWYVRTVGLDLVAKRTVERVAGSHPAKLIRAWDRGESSQRPRGAFVL